MAGLMDLLNSDLGKQIIAGVSGQAGTSEGETSSVLSSVLPALVGGMMNNSQTQDGQSGLLGALLGGKHGGLLDNLSGMLGGGDVQNEGGKILGHVLGDNQGAVQEQVSQNTGIGSDKIAMIMKLAAPILMAYLAKQASGSGLNQQGQTADGGGLGGLLGGLLGGGAQAQSGAQAPSMGGSILTSMLDQDGDGELGIGDAITAATKKGGLGGLLGGLFGK